MRKNKKCVQAVSFLDRELLASAKKLAEESNRSLSGFIRHLIEKEIEVAERVKRVKEAA